MGFVFTEPLNIGGIVGTIVSLLLLGLAVISGLMLYYSPVFCWKGKASPGPVLVFQASGKGVWGGRRPLMLSAKSHSTGVFLGSGSTECPV